MLNRLRRPQAPIGSDDSAASGAGHAGDVLDSAALARLAELDPKGTSRLIQRVLKAFQTSVARLRPQLEAARGIADRPAIRLVAHTLKSSAASIGALDLSALCARIEAALRADAGADIEPLLDAMSTALDRTLGAIERKLETLS